MPTTRRPTAASPDRPASRPGLLAAVLALGTLAGCATTDAPEDAPFALSESYTDGVVSYTVQRGDRLGDIALEFTGEMGRWKEIAASNGIDDPRALRAGAVLRIPAELIPGYAESLAARATERDRSEVVARRGAAREVVPEAAPDEGRTAAGSALAARRAAPPVELSPVDVNRSFELSPLEGESADPAAANDRGATLDVDGTGSNDGAVRRVRVVGSYFPKGVYAQPAAYSRLLMRVAPGTLFELEREVGDWYGVVTESGVGYLRDADAKLLEDALDRSSASLGDARG